ncbi:MAG: hypothetical protein CL765_08035 [Chloroflexi bacterium]|nr:hypothetical protein [Chloroflexota bacterium]
MFLRILNLKVRIMYWKEIPVQVQATDDSETQSLQLEPRFQEAVDAVSMMEGSYGSDEYLDAWEWGEYTEIQGELSEVLKLVANRYNKGMPRDFVSKLRDLHRDGSRKTRPGSIDGWIKSD